MSPNQYAEQLEKRMVKEFKEKFLEKMGYLPIVITRHKTSETGLPVLQLHQLEKCFDPFLPIAHGKIIELKSKSRQRPIVELREFFCAIARQMGLSLKNIGCYLGNRDHTTVINSLRQFKNQMDTNDMYRQRFAIILKHIKEENESSTMDESDQVQYNPQSAVLSGLLSLQN